jgi:CheY-like chemotaxis protein
MPIMDGVAAVKKIRKVNKEIPIIAVTGFSEDHDSFINAGFSYVMQKPATDLKIKQAFANLHIEHN